MATRKLLSLKYLLPIALGIIFFVTATMGNDILAALAGFKGVRTLDTEQAESLISEKGALLVDVRQRAEYEVSRLKNAVLEQDLDLTRLDPEQPILVYCTIGIRSTEWGATLTDQGFRNIYNLNGGIIHWKNEGRPVYNKNQEITDSVHVYHDLFGFLLREGQAVD